MQLSASIMVEFIVHCFNGGGGGVTNVVASGLVTSVTATTPAAATVRLTATGNGTFNGTANPTFILDGVRNANNGQVLWSEVPATMTCDDAGVC